MAFIKKDLSAMATTGAANGNTLWYYRNQDGDTLSASNYFNDAGSMMRVGDLVLNGASGGIARVSNVSPEGVVTVTEV